MACPGLQEEQGLLEVRQAPLQALIINHPQMMMRLCHCQSSWLKDMLEGTGLLHPAPHLIPCATEVLGWPGGWLARHLDMASASSGALADSEDSMAAEVLCSLCEQDYTSSASGSGFWRVHKLARREVRSAAESAAREAHLAAENVTLY